jgi:hypothetical protein
LTPTHAPTRSSATQCLPAVISCHLHERLMQRPCPRHATTRSCRQLPTHCRVRAGVINLRADSSLVQPPPVHTSIRPSGTCPASDYPSDLEAQAETMTQTNCAPSSVPIPLLLTQAKIMPESSAIFLTRRVAWERCVFTILFHIFY